VKKKLKIVITLVIFLFASVMDVYANSDGTHESKAGISFYGEWEEPDVPTDPPKERPEEPGQPPTLPQTGAVNNWPMTLMGVVILVGTLVINNRQHKKGGT
jgi:LPXTG-motif cell wall-anchored protein